MEFIESFNACLGKYFMVMIMIVTVRLNWLGTIVTWSSCRALVLFLSKITMRTESMLAHFSLAAISCNLLDYFDFLKEIEKNVFTQMRDLLFCMWEES